MYLSKALYSMAGIFLSAIFFFTSNTVYGYCCAVGALFGTIYVWLIKNIVKGEIVEIFICDEENNSEYLLATQDKEKVKTLLKSQKASFNLNRDYMFNSKYLLLIAENSSCKLYYGINVQGDKVLKINNKWYEIETTDEIIDSLGKIILQ